MRTLNLGILAHVDAGKTSLTERLLHAAGVIDTIGSVDDGNTQTDTLAQERQRGITIKSAVMSFTIDDVTVNLIDTPGHPDFIAEVERVLGVLDGAVLVVSAVEGVQAQTRILMRTLRRLGIPTLIFVNKIDRGGADCERVLAEIIRKLTPAAIAMAAVRDAGVPDAEAQSCGFNEAAFCDVLTQTLAEHDDTLLAAYVDDRVPSARKLHKALARQTAKALVHPVFFGSAVTGAGIAPLLAGIRDLLPATEGLADGPVSGVVFKIERGGSGERIAYVRLFSGTLRARQRVGFSQGREAKVSALHVFDNGGAVEQSCLRAGQIGKLWGLADVQIGDAIGIRHRAAEHHFAQPTLETVIQPRHLADQGALHAALSLLAEQDPLINLRQDDSRGETYVSLYGEVQKEVIQQTLADEFGLDIAFRETTPICVERPIGSGFARDEAPAPFVATVALRVEPGPVGSGIAFCLEMEFGTLPLSYHKAVEDAVHEALRQGLHGWQVTDCFVTMTEATRVRHWGPMTTAAEHRKLTPLVVMAALKQAGTVVCEPVHRFQLEAPADTLASLLPLLAKLDAVPQNPTIEGASCTLTGTIPAARVHALQKLVPGHTHGEGVLETAFDHYRPVRGAVPERPRTDDNPLNRKDYLLRLSRRG
ncbi:MAG TPA: translation factor GTPase family protein [Mesorhizobium sp.]|jgi:ribosomal protection tetracycline resistance protein|uniref:translation factor GTPase family protein n=1 Tax=Mesorhizobium sp. TaxID=1871066 RepID=UPI002DDC9962|nr:translation factor GTPase family protein [Mesorhizobium sp.]HEV2502497.1 translation factor GTPase family protein [Mesorhizobium sp.]